MHVNKNKEYGSLKTKQGSMWIHVKGLKITDFPEKYSLKVGRGDNLQLFISPLLKYEGWLYNVIDDKILKSIHWNPPVQGVWKFHIPPWGPVEMQKIKILNFVLIVVKMCSNELKRTT